MNLEIEFTEEDKEIINLQSEMHSFKEYSKIKKIKEIENKPLLLGLSGMAYGEEWNRLAKQKEQLFSKG